MGRVGIDEICGADEIRVEEEVLCSVSHKVAERRERALLGWRINSGSGAESAVSRRLQSELNRRFA